MPRPVSPPKQRRKLSKKVHYSLGKFICFLDKSVLLSPQFARGASSQIHGPKAPAARKIARREAAPGTRERALRRLKTVGSTIGLALLVLTVSGLMALPASADLGPVSSFSGPGSADSELNAPKRVAVNQATGTLYVVDQGNDRVQVFTPSGESYAYSAQFGAAELTNPLGIAVDQANGDIYVSDETGVKRFTSALALDATYTNEGVTGPLAIDPTDGDLVVADTLTDTVRTFNDDGSADGSFDGSTSPGGAFTGLRDIAAAPDGDLIVIDTNGTIENQPGGEFATGDSRIERFDSSGAHVATVGPVFRAAAVAVDPATGAYLVSGNQTAVDQNEPPSMSHFGADDQLIRTFKLPISTAQYETVQGLAALSSEGRFFAVADIAYWGGGPYGAPEIHIIEDVAPPQVEIEAATDVTETTATLHGQVNPEGGATEYRFEYTSDGVNFSQTPTEVLGNTGTADTPVEATLEGLDPSLSYGVRLVALKANQQVIRTTPLVTFANAPILAPTVTLDPATELGPDSVVLNGTIHNHELKATYRFEYSIDGGENWSIAPGPDDDTGVDDPLAADDDPQAVSAKLTNLEPDREYLIRLRATTLGGEVTTAAQALTTLTQAPFATTFGAAPRTTTTVRLNGRINPRNRPTTYYFEYGPTASYGQQTPAAPASAGDGNVQILVSEQLTGLQPGTTYHFRLVAQSNAGTTESPDATFTTRTVAEMTAPSRGIELVNQPEKGNQEPVSGAAQTPDGNKVFWNLQTGAPGSPSAYSQFRSERTKATPQWWETYSVLPPIDQLEPNTTYNTVLSISEDGNTFLVRSRQGSGAQGAIRVEPDGSIADLYTAPPDHLPICECVSASMSKDGKRVFLELTRNFAEFKPQKPEQVLDPDHPEGTQQVYEIGDGSPELLSRLPGGQVGTCSALFAVGPFYTHPGIDDGGTRMVFQSQGAACDEPFRLYLRDLETDTTISLGGTPVSGAPSAERLVRIKGDGSEVLFLSESRLDPADQNNLGDVYRWSDAGGTECVTCIVPKAGVWIGGDHEPGVAVSDDFSRFYFTSEQKLLPNEGIQGKPNVYIWREGTIDYVTTLGDGGALATSAYYSDLNPTGEVAVFSVEPARSTTDDTGGVPQMIRYDDRDGSIECISCAPPGVPDKSPAGAERAAGIGLNRLGFLSDDGEDIAFRTTAPLLREDINNLSDIYLWHNGSLQLVTSGAVKWPSDKLNFNSMTPDGQSILFSASARLTGFEKDQVGQLYVSRIGSDNPGPPTPPAPCVEDSCQGPLVTPPVPVQAGSRIFSGPENPKAQKPRKACGKGKKKVKVKGKVRCVPKKGQKRRGNGNRGAGK